MSVDSNTTFPSVRFGPFNGSHKGCLRKSENLFQGIEVKTTPPSEGSSVREGYAALYPSQPIEAPSTGRAEGSKGTPGDYKLSLRASGSTTPEHETTVREREVTTYGNLYYLGTED